MEAGLKQEQEMNRHKNHRKKPYASFVVEHVVNSTFCSSISPHQELVDKIKAYDLSCHTPQECLNFVYELKTLVANYG